MNPEHFDAIARRFAAVGAYAGTRRALLRAVGLGGVAIALDQSHTSAGPVLSSRPTRKLQQAELDPVVDDLAFSLDYDLERIFQFVRDEVVYDAYPGVLRGARGTIWGLAGNAADQAVLLSELLSAALVRTRFVVGELTEEAAASMLAAADTDAQDLRTRMDSLLAGEQPADDDSVTVTPELEAFIAKFPDFSEQVKGIIEQHTAAGIATVTGALDRAGVELPAPVVSLPDEERRRHIWVQYAAGPDWIDLDPSIPGAEAGQIFADNPTNLDALPPDLLHRVSIRVMAEQVVAGSVAENELLTFDAPCTDLLGKPLTFMHPQPDALEGIGVAVSGLIQGFRNYVPTLLVGEETIFGAPVTFGTGEGLLDTFGGEAIEGDTLAEWFEVTVTTPSGTATSRRTMFDRVGDEARAAGEIDLNAIEPLDLIDTGDPESSFLPLTGLWSFSVVAGSMPESVAVQALPPEIIVDDILPALHAFHFARDVQALQIPELANVRLFYNAPNLTAFSLRPSEVEGDGGAATIGIDLLYRSLAVITASSSSSVHPLVAAGALAHAVEQAMFESASLEPLNLPVTATSSVIRVFAAAETEGVGIVVLQPGDAESLIPDIDAGPRRLVQEALDAGLIVIMPERTVELGGRQRIGWWIVDPATGSTWDQMDDGGGSTMSEYAFFILKISACVIAFAGMGSMLGIAVRAARDDIRLGGVFGAIAAGGAAMVACGA